MQRKTAKRAGIGVGVLAMLILAAIVFWDWDWFIPVADSTASSALGRKVTIGHLHVRLGRVTGLEADNVTIDNPDGFPQDRKFLTADRLLVRADVWAYVRGRHIVLPLIEADKAVVEAEQKANGQANWNFSSSTPPKTDQTTKENSNIPQIGNLRIQDGDVHVVDAKVKADMHLKVHTTDPKGENLGQIIVDARGKYANQPITGRFVGGALLSLEDTHKPYPVNLHLANGATKVALIGTLTDPMKFEGADLKLDLSGADMSQLYPLTGIPIPETPAYSIAGQLDYADHKVQFKRFAGRVGSSDLNGEIDVDPTGKKPVVDANLYSRRVDLTDLAGFIGAPPGRAGATPQTPQQKQELLAKENDKKLLPDTPINMPKVEAANVHLKYKGEHIENKYVPLDNIVVAMDIVDGDIRLHPLSFAVGKGSIDANIHLTPENKNIHAVADVNFRKVDLSRIMQATHMFNGEGLIGGSLRLDTNGNSLSSFMGNGDGGIKLVLQGHGDISALLTDLVGLQLGDAVLSAVGIPNRANLECFVADMPLARGTLQTRTFLLDTSETRVTATGTTDFKTEALNFTLYPKSKHFSVGSLSTPIDIKGTLKNPSVFPEAGPLAIKGGLAAGLGIAFPPLALLPTIQMGVGEDGACAHAVQSEAHSPEPTTHKAPVRHR